MHLSPAHPCARSCGADRAIRHTHARYPPSGSFAATAVDAAAVVVEKMLPLKKSPPTLRPTSLRRTFVDRRSRSGSSIRALITRWTRTLYAPTRLITRIRSSTRPSYAPSVVSHARVHLLGFPSPSPPSSPEVSRDFRSAFSACATFPRHAETIPGTVRSLLSGSFAEFSVHRMLIATPLRLIYVRGGVRKEEGRERERRTCVSESRFF